MCLCVCWVEACFFNVAIINTIQIVFSCPAFGLRSGGLFYYPVCRLWGAGSLGGAWGWCHGEEPLRGASCERMPLSDQMTNKLGGRWGHATQWYVLCLTFAFVTFCPKKINVLCEKSSLFRAIEKHSL